MALPELIVLSNRQRVAAMAQNILDGRIGIIEGARLLASLRHRVGMTDFDADFLTFVGIDSETDDLPVGEVRRHWAADALAIKDVEIAKAENFYRQSALASCLRLVARFADQQIPANAFGHDV